MDGIADRIVETIAQVKSKEDAWNASLANHFASNFGDDIANKFASKPGYSIIAAIDRKTVFEISGSGDSIKTKLYDTLYYQDATFVESPVLVNLKEAIRLGKTDPDLEKDWKKKRDLLEQAYVPKYMRDFILKVTEREQKNENPGIIDDIQQAVGGNFYYDPLENDFLFKKKGKTFKCLATASGIKYFGIISILTRTGFLGKRRLLILDEPETSVHPTWQIKLAEVMVKLVKEGCHILLTSHSPYFIEGLKLFADRYLEEEAASFYLTGKNTGAPTSYLKNVTHDISPIFDALSSPFDELEKLQLKDL